MSYIRRRWRRLLCWIVLYGWIGWMFPTSWWWVVVAIFLDGFIGQMVKNFDW
mgnify:CR=1 FL=1